MANPYRLDRNDTVWSSTCRRSDAANETLGAGLLIPYLVAAANQMGTQSSSPSIPSRPGAYC